MATIADAKRLIAASSLEGMRILGAGVSKPCFQGRYNAAAVAALADQLAELTADERRLIASFIEVEEDDPPRSFMLRVRLTPAEHDQLQAMADSEAGGDMSDLVRAKLFE